MNEGSPKANYRPGSSIQKKGDEVNKVSDFRQNPAIEEDGMPRLS